MTALHWAALQGDAPMAEMLLYAGADVSVGTRLGAFTPLDLAAKNGHAVVVEALLKAGADADGADAYGATRRSCSRRRVGSAGRRERPCWPTAREVNAQE